MDLCGLFISQRGGRLTTNQHPVLFYFMERYIFIREYKLRRDDGSVHANISKGSILVKKDADYCTDISDYVDFPVAKDLDPELYICLLRIDADLFKTAFQSFAYTNWMKEKMADIDEQGNPRYPNLTKTPETLIMYLMELGVPADTLFRYMYGPENKYMEYRYLVQEFGKML